MPKSSESKRKKATQAKPPSQQRNDGVQPVSTKEKQPPKGPKGSMEATVPEQEGHQLRLPLKTSSSEFQNPSSSLSSDEYKNKSSQSKQPNPSSSNRPQTNAKDLYTTRSKWLKDSQLHSPTPQDDRQYFAPATKTKAPQPPPPSNAQSTQASKSVQTEQKEEHKSPNSLKTIDLHSSDSSTYDIIDAREVERSIFDSEGMVVAKSGLEGESDFEVLSSDDNDFDDEFI